MSARALPWLIALAAVTFVATVGIASAWGMGLAPDVKLPLGYGHRPAGGREHAQFEERTMSLINWEDSFNFQNPLNIFATHGIPVPTYGNYGGAGYTAGAFGATTPEPSQLTADTRPLDRLDALFFQHDLVHQHFHDGTATFFDVVAGDVSLILRMSALTYTDPDDTNYDPEAGLYEGLAVFGIVLKLGIELKAVGSDLTHLPIYNAIVSATQEAFVNFEAGLEHGSLPVHGSDWLV